MGDSSTYDTSGGPAGLLFSMRLELPELELSRRFRLDRTAEAFAARYLEKCATGVRAGTGAGAVFLESMARLRYRSSIAKSTQQVKTPREEAQREWYRSRIVLRLGGFYSLFIPLLESDESSLHPGGNKEKKKTKPGGFGAIRFCHETMGLYTVPAWVPPR
jgi:hypothetical protein